MDRFLGLLFFDVRLRLILTFLPFALGPCDYPNLV
jgi:hypothetical protein